MYEIIHRKGLDIKSMLNIKTVPYELFIAITIIIISNKRSGRPVKEDI